LWVAGFGSIALYVPSYLIVRSAGRRGRKITHSVPERPGCESCSHRYPALQGASQINLRQQASTHGRRGELFRDYNDGAALNLDIPAQYPTNPPSIAITHPSFTSGSTSRLSSDTTDEAEDHLPTISMRVLLYPIVYTIIILPLSISRWSSGFEVSPGSSPGDSRTVFVTETIYYLGGFANAFLLLYVRRSVNLIGSPPADAEDETNDFAIDPRGFQPTRGNIKDVEEWAALHEEAKRKESTLSTSTAPKRTMRVTWDAGLPD